MVDPGEAAPVLQQLAQARLSLEGILITHHHADHQGGIADLLEKAGARGKPSQDIQVFGPAAESITGCTRPLSGGETLSLLGQPIQVLAVPGHTRGHLAYRMDVGVFCGDTLFGAGCGRIFEGTAAQMWAALETLSALPDNTLFYCAHEYTALNLRFALAVEPDNPDIAARLAQVAALRAAGQPTVPLSLAEEKASNPFLRCREPAVIDAACRHGAIDTSPLAVFTALRAWRNTF